MRDKSSAGTRFVAVEFSEDVEGGDEADEVETHDEDHGRADLQPRSVIRVELQHVASASGTTAPSNPPEPLDDPPIRLHLIPVVAAVEPRRAAPTGPGREVEEVDAWDWDEPFTIV
ncbi:preprotein translocase Sec, Sec61-beta subunit protein [Actinidia rufa]|uniref:Preprotein translocase Sec, Sec61-beta subunit protein n=1 Tax=Actinidia rufa TaxID=165716 RepID=A0A7J0DAD6_9ERIC|nr:preprotein translocase Sec, Sec61-beta subunit protein [Actinidia rufa]